MIKEKDSLLYVGLDVSKATLDCGAPEIKRTSFENNHKGHKKLITFLGDLKCPVQIILESSGNYERSIILALQQAQIDVSRVHAARVRFFAKSLGQQAKTDQIDAMMLAAFGRANKPPVLKNCDHTLEGLRALCDRRTELVNARTAETNRLAQAHPSIHRGIKKHLAFLKKEITNTNADIKKFLAQHLELENRSLTLQRVKGVGLITAATILSNLPELGALNKNEAGALCGVAPYNHDSGAYQGRRFIKGGRPALRAALYMAALSAIKSNFVLKDFYQSLIKRNKPKKLALVAVMRKLIICLNSLLKNPNFSLAT